jgi:hypothetical protein
LEKKERGTTDDSDFARADRSELPKGQIELNWHFVHSLAMHSDDQYGWVVRIFPQLFGIVELSENVKSLLYSR